MVSEGGEMEVAVEEKAVAAVAAARHLKVLGVHLEQRVSVNLIESSKLRQLHS